MFPSPYCVERALHFVEQPFVVRSNPSFEIASMLAFRAEASAREVGRAEIKSLPINRNHLQMYSQTAAHQRPRFACRFEAQRQPARRRTCMQYAYVDASCSRLPKLVEKTDVAAARSRARAQRRLYVYVLEVGRGNPDARLDFADTSFDDLIHVFGVAQQANHRGAAIGSFRRGTRQRHAG